MNKQVLIVTIVVGLAALAFWQLKLNQGQLNSTSTDELNYQDLTAAEFDQKLKTSEVFLLDTHIPEQEHIAGTDAVIPFNEIGSNLNKLPSDKSTEILVYCRSGRMSEIASETLLSLGYTNVYNLVGGKRAYDEYLRQNREDTEIISISPKNQDLGTVVFGEVRETSFIINNNTDQVVTLTRVSTSCGCTKAFPEKELLQPGESISMKVTFDPAVHGDATDLGELTRTIYVQTDHPNFPEFENTITANVIKP